MKIVISVGAFLAFISTANSGIMTASRYPFGMSRDKLLPGDFQKISSKFKTPYVSILFTGAFMILAILFLKLELLVKVASSILILLYIFANLTLILFRESKISSYRPKFRSPFYPYLQALGISGGLFLLIEMGTFIIFLTVVFLLLGFAWYKAYAQKRTSRDSALIYALERLVAVDKELTSDNLLTELKDIVIKDNNAIKVLLVRAKAGVIFSQDKVVHIIFVLVGSSAERVLHLKILAAIAQIVQDPEFYEKWIEVTNKEELKNIVLLAERKRG